MSTASACSRPSASSSTSSARARSAFSPPRSRKSPIPGSATPSPTTRKPVAEPLPGFRAGHPGGVLRAVSGRCRRFRGSARRDGQAPPQRCELLLRDGNLGRARLRLPLRLPRPAASRDHPGAARARIQSRPDRDRAVGDLQDQAAPTANEIEIHNPVDMPDRVKIEEIQEPWIEATILTPDEYLGSVLKLCQDRRGDPERAHLCRQPRAW